MLPYHENRRPPDLERADYIVSSNLGRTLHANRQAVLDAKRAVDWLEEQGHERIGIIGTSLGSCLSMLAMSHDPRIKAGAFNHVSPYFADVVWRGLSTRHVREGLEGAITLEALRNYWMPISPWPFIDRVKTRDLLLVYARYDLTFPVDLSRMFLAGISPTRRGPPDGPAPVRSLHDGQSAVQVHRWVSLDEVLCDQVVVRRDQRTKGPRAAEPVRTGTR